MKNPFRSEAEAYRFVLGTVAYFAAIVIATAVGGRWWGVAVFVVVSRVVLWWFFRREMREQPPASRAASRSADDGERRILVVANETVAGRKLRDAIKARGRGRPRERARRLPGAELAAPALGVGRGRRARAAERPAAAQRRRARRGSGIDARGEVGDADPLQAIEDALRTFGADEIIISTHPEGRSNWLERGVVTTARERFAVPLTHVVVDLQAESAGA